MTGTRKTPASAESLKRCLYAGLKDQSPLDSGGLETAAMTTAELLVRRGESLQSRAALTADDTAGQPTTAVPP